MTPPQVAAIARPSRVRDAPPRLALEAEAETPLGGSGTAERGEHLGLGVAAPRDCGVDRRRGAAAVGDRLHDRARPGHHVAAGEDADPARLQRARVGHDAGPAGDLDPRAIGQDRGVGFLADGDEERARLELELAARDRLVDAAPVGPGPGRLQLLADDPGEAAVAAAQLADREAVRITTSSASAASISSGWAGISARPRR